MSLGASRHCTTRLAFRSPTMKGFGETALFGATSDVLHVALPKITSARRLAMSYPPRKDYGGTQLFGDTGNAMSRFHSHFAEFIDQQTPRKERKNYLNKITASVITPSLPPGWTQCFDQESGQIYFHHHQKGLSQWKDPSRVVPVTNQAYQRPFRANRSELPLSRGTHRVVSKLNLAAGHAPTNAARLEARTIMSIWLRKIIGAEYFLNWMTNQKENEASSRAFKAALRAARNLATLRKYLWVMMNYVLASAFRQFKQNYRKWKHKYARVKANSKKSKTISAGRKLALICAREAFSPGARSISQAKFTVRIVNSKEFVMPGIKLAQFGAWLISHDFYNWRRLKRGKEMKEYDMMDLERAGDGWFAYMVQQKEMKDHVLERLEIARHPSGWWPRVARAMLHGYWTTAYTWWQQKLKDNPAITDSVTFSGAGLARALWVCSESGAATADLAQMVNQVALAAAVTQAGSDLYKKAKRTLSDAELVAAKDMFLQFDVDGSGTIEMAELHSMLQTMGFGATMDQTMGLLETVADDATGEIEFAEFVELLETIPGLKIC